MTTPDLSPGAIAPEDRSEAASAPDIFVSPPATENHPEGDAVAGDVSPQAKLEATDSDPQGRAVAGDVSPQAKLEATDSHPQGGAVAATGSDPQGRAGAGDVSPPAKLEATGSDPQGRAVAGGPLLDSKTNTAAATWALFLGLGFLMLGNGLQGSVVGIRSQLEGFSTVSTGVVMAAYFVGFLAGSKGVTRALRGVGHIRVFAALASLASTAVLIYAMAVVPVAWFAMRFITGFCMAGLYVVVESWINDLATNATRGRMLGLYMVVSMGGVGGGQFLLNVANPQGFELFVIASVLVSASLVPITLSATSAPPSHTPAPMPLRDLAAVVPTGLVIAFLVGMAHGALIGMGAVYATGAGLRPAAVAVFLGAPMVGGVVFQMPIGWLADRFPRRGVMLVVAMVATVCAAGLLVVDAGSIASYGLMFVLGGASFPLYSLGIAYTNDWIEPHQIAGAASGLVMTNGIGAVLGPLLTAGLIAAFANSWFFVILGATHLAAVVYLIYRLVTRDGLPIEDQNEFRPFPARATSRASALTEI